MLYTVSEISELIGLSRVTLYKKIKSLEMSTHISKKQNVTYIDEEGLNLIKDNLQGLSNEEEHNASDDYIAIDSEDSSLNKDMFNLLKTQLMEKDKQLSEANERLKQAHKLIENNQVLLKDKPKQEMLQLESHFEDLDIKLEAVKNNMIERKEQQRKKGFLNNLFKKKIVTNKQ